MATAFKQENRLLALTTPLGPDVLLLSSFAGQEALSRLFSYRLDMWSDEDAIAAKDIVGQAVTWGVESVNSEPRYFSGVVSRFVAGATRIKSRRHYRAEVVPWLWLLTRTANCRIFQNMSVPDIIEKVFKDLGFSAGTNYQLSLNGSYAPRDYCVQYRETAFNFVSRLMEYEGIYYFFKHDNGKHVLVLADAASSYFDCQESEVEYFPGSLAANHIHTWEHQYEFRTGKHAHTDYNFETPATSLLTNTNTKVPVPGVDGYEIFDYPGAYGKTGDGTAVIKVRMEEEEAAFDVVSGSSRCCTFTPGGKFKLSAPDCPSEEGKYVVTSVQHSGAEASYHPGATGSSYQNSFTCIPAAVPFRPARLTPCPVVQGVQTAVVVGPGGEEIYTDKYGRVKVQFFWDREGKKDENSSCWVRVSQNWAGKNWGVMFNPRMGQEVIVDFLEGDPDRPLITGRVYNAVQMPPYPPGNNTMSTIKTRSSKGGGAANFNEIRFEDKTGSEQLFIHAEKNQDIEVEKDETHWVGHDRTKTIDNDETTHVKHDRTETVDNNETITIHGQRTETVDKDETITIHQNRTETVDKEETITIHGGRTETVDKDENITINGGRTETVAKEETITINGGRTETVAKDENITINGGRTETIAKEETITINGGRTETVAKEESVTVNGGRTVNIAKADSLTVGKTLSITATESITLTTGSASITMKKDGTITIEGKDITCKGSGQISHKADKDVVIKGQKVLQN